MADRVLSSTAQEEMQVLRSEGHTLKAIGRRFGISKQRVHQLLGNTGHKAQYLGLNDAEWLVGQRAMGNKGREIAQVLGCSQAAVSRARKRLGLPPLQPKWDHDSLEQALRDWVQEHGLTLTSKHIRATDCCVLSYGIDNFGGYVYWRSHLGQRLDPASPVSKGRYFEWQAFCALQAHGHTAQTMPWRHPFDILVDGKLRVEVKGSNTTGRYGHFQFCFRQSNGHNLDCDILMLACKRDGIEWLIVPLEAVGDRQGVYVASDYGKWAAYHEAWYIMEQATTLEL